MMMHVKSRYRAFVEMPAGVDAYLAFQRVLYGTEDHLLACFEKMVMPHLRLESEPAVLADIGGGDARRTMAILGMMEMQGRTNMHIEFVEPSPVMMECASKRLPVHARCHRCSFEDVEWQQVPDIALFVHSIFAIDPQELADKIVAMCGAGCQCVILGDHVDGLVRKLKSEVDQVAEGARTTLGEVEARLLRSGLAVAHMDYSIPCIVPKAEFSDFAQVLYRWLSLGGYVPSCAFLRLLESLASCEQGAMRWQERERALLVRNDE